MSRVVGGSVKCGMNGDSNSAGQYAPHHSPFVLRSIYQSSYAAGKNVLEVCRGDLKMQKEKYSMEGAWFG